MSASGLKRISWLILVVATAALAACGRDNRDNLDQWIAGVEARHEPAIAAVPETRAYPAFALTTRSLRSPFLPAGPVAAGSERATTRRGEGYLEQFALDDLSLVGEFAAGGKTWALIRDPHGLISRVGIGDRLGQNGGRIVAITAGAIAVRETAAGVTGGAATHSITLPLAGQSGN